LSLAVRFALSAPGLIRYNVCDISRGLLDVTLPDDLLTYDRLHLRRWRRNSSEAATLLSHGVWYTINFGAVRLPGFRESRCGKEEA
jgi:hypothetical protein